jgi:uncharacterized membrane protein
MFQDAAAAGSLTQTLTNLAAPWAKIYSHSKGVSATVSFFHLAPLIFGAGAAFITDRATLRAHRMGNDERNRQLVELGRIHSVVLFGLALSFISGILMFLSDVETFLPSVFLWIKLGLVALLLVNGFVMTQTEKALSSNNQDAKLWNRLRAIAILSAVLWLATTLAGVVLKEYA